MKKLLCALAVGISTLGSTSAFAGYGAIAYSPSTGANGGSWSYSCASEATSAAVAACGQADCTNEVWVQNGCAAFAVATNGASGWAWNAHLGMAEANALMQCSTNGQGCYVVRWVCS